MPNTSSPSAKPSARETSTVPETSLPSTAGNCLGMIPRRYFQSIGLIETARTLINTSPSPGSGRSSSSMRSTSGPPVSRSNTACMGLLLVGTTATESNPGRVAPRAAVQELTRVGAIEIPVTDRRARPQTRLVLGVMHAWHEIEARHRALAALVIAIQNVDAEPCAGLDCLARRRVHAHLAVGEGCLPEADVARRHI